MYILFIYLYVYIYIYIHTYIYICTYMLHQVNTPIRISKAFPGDAWACDGGGRVRCPQQ